MSLFMMLAIILVTSLLTCSILCYIVFVLLRKVRTLEQLFTESKSIMQNMSDVQQSNLESQTGKNPLLMIISSKQEIKDGILANDEANGGDKTIH
jgi:hypothetical protein